MNIADIILIVIIAAVIVRAVIYCVKHPRKKGCGCGCEGCTRGSCTAAEEKK